MTTKFRFCSLVALLAFTLVGCLENTNIEPAQQIIQNVQEEFAPDSRVAVFDVEASDAQGALILKGETNLPNAREALLDSLNHLDITHTDSIRTLPEKELGDTVYAVANNSASNMRSEPSHPAQLATQVILGMPLNVLKREGEWYLVQSPDDYISWIDGGGIQLMDEAQLDEWKSAEKLIYLDTYGFAYKEASSEAEKVSDLVSGNILELLDEEGSFYQVGYPDGRTGYVSKSQAAPLEDWRKSLDPTEEDLVSTAREMTGVPYLWGGTSTKGVDCSGFTKTIYFMNGKIIPRDASQQVHAGEQVDTSKEFDKLRPGDLLFFGTPATDSTDQRVVHVGMWIGNDEFIHASRRVRVSSIDPEAENYDEYNLNRYLETRRYLGSDHENIYPAAEIY